MNELTEVRHRAVRNYVQEFGSVSKTSLARLLVAEHPLLFDDVEKTRNLIKYITGNAGHSNRDKIKDKTNLKETKIKNMYGLCEENHNDFTPYTLPKSSKKIGVIADIHIPYQDNQAVTLALDYFKDKEVDTIVINGDLIDFYGISRFIRDPGQRNLHFEIDAARAFLKALRDEFPKALIVYKTGNHEDRWKHFLMLKAPEVFSMAEFRLDIILKMPELGIIFVDDKKMIKAGKLNIIHGHEYSGAYSPVNPAKAYHSRAMTNVIAGHNHQSSEHISKDANDEITGGWSLGCLCELHPLYMPLNKWVHGFATVDIESSGRFRVINKMIINGEIV